MSGFSALFYKEVLRFLKVGMQTLAAPVITGLLYLLIFSHTLSSAQVYPGVSYVAFLVPGLAMLSMLQNAAANASSSLIQSKVTGNIVFLLLSPISTHEFFAAYVLASLVRALLVGLGLLFACLPFAPLPFPNLLWFTAFAFLGGLLMGSVGIIGGIWAEKFDQLAGFQNFIIVPATFLAGAFYSTHSLPPFWRAVSHLNPFFYIIDGFRYSFFGHSDFPVWGSLAIVATGAFAVSLLAIRLIRSGYKLRH